MSNEELSLKQISDKLNIPQSTVSGILSTLIQFGYIEKLDDYKYDTSIYLFELGNKVRSKWSLYNISIPYLKNMNNEINENINLVILNNGKVLYLYKEMATYEFYIGTSVGTRLPAHCTAVGKSLMAYLPESEVENIIENEGMKKYTDNTITTLSELKEEFKKIKIQGYAIDNEELMYNLICVAAPIGSSENKIAAISVSGLSSRLKGETLKQAIYLVKDNALKISRKLGY